MIWHRCSTPFRQISIHKQEVLGRTKRLRPYYMTQTAYKTKQLRGTERDTYAQKVKWSHEVPKTLSQHAQSKGRTGQRYLISLLLFFKIRKVDQKYFVIVSQRSEIASIQSHDSNELKNVPWMHVM
jgi:hypothetical protein